MKFLLKTAWTTDIIKSYGLFHIIFFLFGMLLSYKLAYKLKNTSQEQNNKILYGIGIILLLSEIYKQLFYTFVIGGGNYQWWIFPFQLCSIPMYLCFIIPLLKNNNYKKQLYNFLSSYGLLGGIISFIEPSGLIHPYITLTAHAFIWHMLIVFLGLYIAISGRGAYKKEGFRGAFYIFIILFIIAIGINIAFNKISNFEINMFFAGPNISPLIIFSDIAFKYGFIINDLIYIIVVSIGAFIIYMLFVKRNLKLSKNFKY